MFIQDCGETVEIDCTREELDAHLRKWGLVGDADNQFPSTREFITENDISVWLKRAQPKKITFEDLKRMWV